MPPFRSVLTGFALLVTLGAGALVIRHHITDEATTRPHDFLQVWSAGRLALQGESAWDGKQLLDLQKANRAPAAYASMMWVPPWGLVIAMPIGALSVDVAQAVWVYGQLALILLTALAVWRAYGGPANRLWVPAVLVIACGPVWWQVSAGQYAGLLFAGIGGYLIAHRFNRPVLAGACLFLIALKPHLFALFAIGLIIDALRTGYGRKVVLGGAAVLLTASAVVTAVNPHLWGHYHAAATGGYTDYYPGFYAWFPPTIQAVVRNYVPGRPIWVQFVPIALVAPAFAVYWWRHGRPDRWPTVLVWLVPVQLLITPYSGWASDLTLLLVPVVLLAVKLDAIGWPIPRRGLLAATYLIANAMVPALWALDTPSLSYAWVTPVIGGCLLWASWPLQAARPRRATPLNTDCATVPAVPLVSSGR